MSKKHIIITDKGLDIFDKVLDLMLYYWTPIAIMFMVPYLMNCAWFAPIIFEIVMYAGIAGTLVLLFYLYFVLNTIYHESRKD